MFFKRERELSFFISSNFVSFGGSKRKEDTSEGPDEICLIDLNKFKLIYPQGQRAGGDAPHGQRLDPRHRVMHNLLGRSLQRW